MINIELKGGIKMFNKKDKNQEKEPQKNIVETLPELENNIEESIGQGIEIPDDYEFVLEGHATGALTKNGKPIVRYTIETTRQLKFGMQ